MPFEYDSTKSKSNKLKHGIDFEEAQLLWLDTSLVEVPVFTSDEPRWVVIGKIGEKHWSAVITRREESIRLISARRSRETEKNIYENQDIEREGV
jgi:uncharacterized DUF497 family protein